MVCWTDQLLMFSPTEWLRNTAVRDVAASICAMKGMRLGERVPSYHERRSTLFAFFYTSAVTFSFALALQWAHRLRSPFTGGAKKKKSCLSWLSDTVCVTEHERTSGPCITTQSGGRLGCSEREAEVVLWPDTAGKEKTTLPNKAGRHSSLFPSTRSSLC